MYDKERFFSPSLFCVHLDTVLARLREAGVGCHVGGSFGGAFEYTDDVTLLDPSRQALQIMLNICEDSDKGVLIRSRV